MGPSLAPAGHTLIPPTSEGCGRTPGWGGGRGTGVRESWGWDEGYQWQARRCPQEVTGAFGDGHWGLWTQGLVGVQWRIDLMYDFKWFWFLCGAKMNRERQD